MSALRILILIIAGVISAPLLDVVSMAWMRSAPMGIDLVGNYFTSVAIPIVMIIHLLAALLLWKLFEPQAIRNCCIYVLSHAIAQAAMWNAFNNPVGDIVSIVVIILLSGGLVMGVFHRFFWCPACMQINQGTSD